MILAHAMNETAKGVFGIRDVRPLKMHSERFFPACSRVPGFLPFQSDEIAERFHRLTLGAN
jgi:hypothetical protein